jgi:major membrane immunogen (membrane-anchored lipoprotein)
MLKTKIIAIVIVFSVLLAACSASENSSISPSSPSGSSEPELARTQDKSGGGGGGGRDEDVTGSGTGSGNGVINNQKSLQNQVSLENQSQTEPEKPIERKIIRNAELRLESDAPEEAQQKITAIAEGKGGFVIESTQQGSDVTSVKRDTVTMTIRVPAAKFNETLDEIRKAANRVIVETVKGQDVTEEFIDIEANLKTKKALEEQFLEIMKRSNSVADALNVQRELANVRGEIEKIEGRKRFLENQSSLSTIKVTLQTPTVISGSSKGFFYRLTEALSTGLDGALSFILFFVTALIAILPFLILVVLPIYLFLRYFWRKYSWKRRTKPQNTVEIVAEEIKDE